jgi:hypothetical protein
MFVLSLLFTMTWIVTAYDGVTTSDKMKYFVGETIRFTQVGGSGQNDVASSQVYYILPEYEVPVLLSDLVAKRNLQWWYLTNNCGVDEISVDGTTKSITCPFSFSFAGHILGVLDNFTSRPVSAADRLYADFTNISSITQKSLETDFVMVTVNQTFHKGGTYRSREVTSVSNPFLSLN